MGKRAAVVFTFFALVVLQWLAPVAEPPQQLYTFPPTDAFLSYEPLIENQQRMSVPPMMASRADAWDYDVAFNAEDVQRRVMERLFRKPPPGPALAEKSEDVALQMAAKEVLDVARKFGKAEVDFADKWLTRVMATEDPKARLDILDECFVEFTFDCKRLDDALRRFRMLLAPHTAVVKNAKQHVRSLALKFDSAKQRLVEAWMQKVQRGQIAEDPSEVLDECVISSAMGGLRSMDCFDFEEALRNYKAAADLWAFQPVR